MSFYTAEYIKKLVKEDQNKFIDIVKKKDVRSYIDRTLPFTLYLDLNNLTNSGLLNKDNEFIRKAVLIPGIDEDALLKEITRTYKQLIKYYQSTYKFISPEELQAKLNNFASAVEANDGRIVSTLSSEFKQTYVFHNNGPWVIIIAPKFNTIQENFGPKFREFFNPNVFSSERNPIGDNFPSKDIFALLSSNFEYLQNLGHIETDLITSNTGTEVKRGLVTPKLLQALIQAPKSIPASRIARTFSRQTGQAKTRIIVRKKFSGTKLILEMLVESGFMIGTPERRDINVGYKAPLERAFGPGSTLKKEITTNPNFFLKLETSKSIIDFLQSSVLSQLEGKVALNYISSTTIDSKSSFTVDRVKLNSFDKRPETLKKLRTPKGKFISPVSIMNLLNSRLAQQIQNNMGKGSAKAVLNYRTGRLAESAEVVNVTNRGSAIIAFYSYMKNPYATFAPGGAQSSPASRDPNKLIQLSIRQLATGIMANRLKVVPV